MRGGRRQSRARDRRGAAPPAEREPPIPLEAVDLLAGLAPGVELHADDLPPGIASETPPDTPQPARTTVDEAGRLVRSGEETIRRLIRTAALRPVAAGDRATEPGEPYQEIDRAGVLPRSRDKPGE